MNSHAPGNLPGTDAPDPSRNTMDYIRAAVREHELHAPAEIRAQIKRYALGEISLDEVMRVSNEVFVHQLSAVLPER